MEINLEIVGFIVGFVLSLIAATWTLSSKINNVELRLNEKLANIQLELTNHLHTQIDGVEKKINKLMEKLYEK